MLHDHSKVVGARLGCLREAGFKGAQIMPVSRDNGKGTALERAGGGFGLILAGGRAWANWG